MANSRPWVSIFRPFQILIVLVLVINLEIYVAADGYDNDNDGGDGGGDDGAGSLHCTTDDTTTFLPPPYNNVSNIACKPVWNTYTLMYSQTKDHVVTIILSTLYTSGWVGIGFSKDGLMVGASAMVGWVNRKGHAKIKQYYIQGSTVYQVVPNRGELPLTNVPAVVALHGASIYLAFQMKFDQPLVNQPILLAFGGATPIQNRLSPHDDKTTIIFDFSRGSISDSGASEKKGQRKEIHGIMGTIGWGLILPIGAIIARYFRHKEPLWFYLHTVIQFMGFLLILANLVIGQSMYTGKDSDQRAHKSIGIFAYVLSILQVMAFFLRPNKEAKIRRYWNWYHHWFGRLALFFGAVNIVLGIQIGGAKSDWKIGYGFLLGTILTTCIILEALAFLRRSDSKPTQLPAFQMNPIE